MSDFSDLPSTEESRESKDISVMAVLDVLADESEVASIELIVDRLCLEGVLRSLLVGLELP